MSEPVQYCDGVQHWARCNCCLMGIVMCVNEHCRIGEWLTRSNCRVAGKLVDCLARAAITSRTTNCCADKASVRTRRHSTRRRRQQTQPVTRSCSAQIPCSCDICPCCKSLLEFTCFTGKTFLHKAELIDFQATESMNRKWPNKK